MVRNLPALGKVIFSVYILPRNSKNFNPKRKIINILPPNHKHFCPLHLQVTLKLHFERHKELALASPCLLVFLPEEGGEQGFVLGALFGDVVAVALGEVVAKGVQRTILLGVSTSGAPRRSCVYCLCNSSVFMLLSFRYISLPTSHRWVDKGVLA